MLAFVSPVRSPHTSYSLDLTIISGIINTKKIKIGNIVTKTIHDDIVHEDSEDIAILFNNYIVGIGKSIAEH